MYDLSSCAREFVRRACRFLDEVGGPPLPSPSPLGPILNQYFEYFV